MATNLVPGSSSFVTALMKPDVGDDGSADWAQKLAENTGFNKVWQDDNAKRFLIAIGESTVTHGAGASYLVDLTGGDKIVGVSAFTGSGTYVVAIIRKSQGSGIHLSAQTASTFSLQKTAHTDPDVDVQWVAVGY